MGCDPNGAIVRSDATVGIDDTGSVCKGAIVDGRVAARDGIEEASFSVWLPPLDPPPSDATNLHNATSGT